MEHPFQGNVVNNFWPEHSSEMSNQLQYVPEYADLYEDMDPDWKAIFQHPFPAFPNPKPFGATFLPNVSLDHNGLIREQQRVLKLTSILANIPYKTDAEVRVLNDVLFGPPTIEAARRCMYYPSICHSLFSQRSFI